jgi:hypothetical protein
MKMLSENQRYLLDNNLDGTKEVIVHRIIVKA